MRSVSRTTILQPCIDVINTHLFDCTKHSLIFLASLADGREMSSRDKDMAPWHFHPCLIVVMTLSVTHPVDQIRENNLLFFTYATVSGAEQGGRKCCAMTHSGEFT